VLLNRPIIVWFRRDLRIDDHAALFHAARQRAPIIPLFIFDTDVIGSLSSDGAAFEYQAKSLSELSSNIESLGGKLVIRHGRAAEVHKTLIREVEPVALFYHRDYEPFATERDHRVEDLYRTAGAEVKALKDVVIHEPGEVLNQQGNPYVVFTPYAKSWKKLPHPVGFGKPRRFNTPEIATGRILRAKDIGRSISIPNPLFTGGEKEALQRWNHFLDRAIGSYGKDRDIPSIDGTSRMSVALRFGCISVRRMLENCRVALEETPRSRQESIVKFMDELIWREFYQSVIFHLPRLVDSSYRKEFDSMVWRNGATDFRAWQEGRTGFPLVDAGMRQLMRTGWMHNRIRMVVASFLTKDLRIDWRRGAAYFEEKLLDIETASNIGGWQWSASAGVDPKPMRIFNPILQSQRFDPKGEYIKKFIPELRNVPLKFIHEPHTMPSVLQRDLDCIIGKHYPRPIVDHAIASAEFKRRFSAVKQRL
jgi:deoxyribodipyrimidine photo-lyase